MEVYVGRTLSYLIVTAILLAFGILGIALWKFSARHGFLMRAGAVLYLLAYTAIVLSFVLYSLLKH